LKISIEGGKLDLRDRKREKTLSVLSNFNSSELKILQNKIISLNKQLDALEELIGKSTIIQDYNEQDYLLLHHKQKIDSLNKKIEAHKRAIEKIETEKLKKDIIKQAKDGLNMDLSII